MEEEDVLSDYFPTMAKLHHVTNPKCARKLAYDLAMTNDKQILASWKKIVLREDYGLTAL